MNKGNQEKPTVDVVSQEEIQRRYERAQAFNHGMFSSSVARNSTLFPVWIGKSNCFWYQRELKEGKEFRLVDASTGTNKPAFNHEALASVLAEASGEKEMYSIYLSTTSTARQRTIQK